MESKDIDRVVYIENEEDMEREVKRVKRKKNHYKNVLDVLFELDKIDYNKCCHEDCYEYSLNGPNHCYVSIGNRFIECGECKEYYCKSHVFFYRNEDSSDAFICESCYNTQSERFQENNNV